MCGSHEIQAACKGDIGVDIFCLQRYQDYMKIVIPEMKVAAMREPVAEALRRALLEGAFSPGEELSEVDLAAQLKVSRGPVREALLMLAQEGLVTHAQNRGFSVLRITNQDLSQIYQVREPLEALVLHLAKDRISTENLRHLERLKNRIVKGMASEQFRDAVRSDLEFHTLIAEVSGNPWLEGSLRRLMVPYFTFIIAFWKKPEQLTLQQMAEEHKLYCDYLKGETTLSAEECVHSHYQHDSHLQELSK
jgi:DNA-binding GntR family transcriptional regulator